MFWCFEGLEEPLARVRAAMRKLDAAAATRWTPPPPLLCETERPGTEGSVRHSLGVGVFHVLELEAQVAEETKASLGEGIAASAASSTSGQQPNGGDMDNGGVETDRGGVDMDGARQFVVSLSVQCVPGGILYG